MSGLRTNWKYFNLCPVFESIIKPNGSPVDEDQIDFGMRDAARFDGIFYRGLFNQMALDTCAGCSRSKKKVEISMKIEPNREWFHVIS
jgi:hypothetical protein